MLTFIQKIPQKNSTGFLYSYDDATDVLAQSIIDNADAPFTFQGKVGDRQAELHPMHIKSTIEDRHGQVAGRAIINGNNALVAFQPNQQVMISLPLNCSQADADQLVGMAFGGEGYDDFGGGFDDFDEGGFDGDDFGGDDFGNEDYEDYSDGDMNDQFDMPSGFDSDDNDPYANMPDPMGRSAAGIDPRMAMAQDQNAGVVKVSDWLLTLILLMIPVVNIVVLILWLVSKKTNQSKKNFLKVELIFIAVGLLLSIFTVVAAQSMGINLVGMMVGGNTPQAAQQQQASDFDNSNEADDSANANSNDNQKSNANSNEDIDNQNAPQAENTTPQTVEPFNSDRGQIESIVKETTMSGENIAIINVKCRNWKDVEASPFDLFLVECTQGQNALPVHMAGTSSYDPSKWSAKLAPGAETIFQIAFRMVDDQDVHAKITSITDPNDLVAEVSKHLV